MYVLVIYNRCTSKDKKTRQQQQLLLLLYLGLDTCLCCAWLAFFRQGLRVVVLFPLRAAQTTYNHCHHKAMLLSIVCIMKSSVLSIMTQ